MGIDNSGAPVGFSAFETNATNPYFAYPYSTSKLLPSVRHGLIAPGVLSLLSILTTSGLLIYLAQRFINWRKYSKTYLGYNQYLVLFINLLLADLIQAMSFVISLHWIQIDALLAPTPACTAQGWLLNMGDVASGFFVLLIAAFTFHSIINGRRIAHKLFVAIIAFTWLFSFVLTFIGPAMYGRTYYVRTGVWCWASALYETERLALHYIWIFAIQALTLIIYVAVFIHVRASMRQTSSIMARGMASTQRTAARSKIDRATRSMLLYPIAYICLTLPLSAGRMWSLAHNGAFLPNAYVLVAGSLMASSGVVDALLYAITRSQMMHTGTTTNGSTDPVSSLGNNGAQKRPGMLRGLSARFDSKHDPQPQSDLPVVEPKPKGPTPDPYSLDDFRSIRRRSSAPDGGPGNNRRRSSLPKKNARRTSEAIAEEQGAEEPLREGSFDEAVAGKRRLVGTVREVDESGASASSGGSAKGSHGQGSPMEDEKEEV